MTLAKERPQEYPKGTPPLGSEEIASLSEEVPGWSVEGDRLEREFGFSDFKGSMGFVTQVALLAEEMSHHPDISVSWDKVRLSFWTHTADGLTRNDFIMAARVDGL